MRISHALVFIAALALAPLTARAQWAQTNGPYGATVNCIDTLGRTIFVGTNRGVFESTDSAKTWQIRSKGLPQTFIYSLATLGSQIFAGTYQNGVYRSTDSGATWRCASTGLPNSYTADALGSSSNALFSPNGSQTYLSSNSGNHWSLVDTNLTDISNPQVVLTVGSETYLAGEWITRTSDDGKHWDVLATPPPDATWQCFSLVNLGSVLFAEVFEEGFGDGQEELLRSTDHGKTWNNVCPDSLNGDITNLGVKGNQVYAGTYNGLIYRSDDTGESWQLASSGLPANAYVDALASNGSELLVGFDGQGFYRSTDGKTWDEFNHGLTNLSTNAFAATGDSVFASTDAGLFVSLDNGASWMQKSNGLPLASPGPILIDENKLYWSSQSSYPPLICSTDYGQSWAPDSALKVVGGLHTLVKCAPNIIAGGGDGINSGIFFSSNSGLSWTMAEIRSSYENTTFNGIAKIGQTLIAATSGGVYLSSDNGNSWGVSHFAGVNAISVGTAESRVFLCAYGSLNAAKRTIFVSDDSGINWRGPLDSTTPPRVEVTSFTSVENNLFVATDSNGIYFTSDYGAHWIDENQGLTDSSILSLAIQGDELLAGTANSGVWRRPLAEMIPPSSVASFPAQPDSIVAYPNPGGDDVTVSAPGISGIVQASLISETGAVVWRKDITMSGSSLRLYLASVPSGTYVLELKSGTGSRTCKLVLSK